MLFWSVYVIFGYSFGHIDTTFWQEHKLDSVVDLLVQQSNYTEIFNDHSCASMWPGKG
jgi:hypothetical protein